LTLLSIGLTLTYLTTKVPNFAHATYAALGSYITLTSVKVFNLSPYSLLFLALIIGGITSLAQYQIIFKPLLKKGASITALMITTLAIELILLSLLNIYADYLSNVLKIRSRYFLYTNLDIELFGQKGLLIIAPLFAAISVTLLYLALTRTKFGISMRAAIEDPSLASVMGINVNLVYSVSWFIAGGLGSLSGGLLPLWFPANPDIGTRMIISAFAASVVGGLLNIYGAVLGGFLIGLSEILGTSILASSLGAWIIPYRPLIPLIAIAITLLLAPSGLLGVRWSALARNIQKRFF
jgi:branched-chain amino acid transport system permease protein